MSKVALLLAALFAVSACSDSEEVGFEGRDEDDPFTLQDLCWSTFANPPPFAPTVEMEVASGKSFRVSRERLGELRDWLKRRATPEFGAVVDTLPERRLARLAYQGTFEPQPGYVPFSTISIHHGGTVLWRPETGEGFESASTRLQILDDRDKVVFDKWARLHYRRVDGEWMLARLPEWSGSPFLEPSVVSRHGTPIPAGDERHVLELRYFYGRAPAAVEAVYAEMGIELPRRTPWWDCIAEGRIVHYRGQDTPSHHPPDRWWELYWLARDEWAAGRAPGAEDSPLEVIIQAEAGLPARKLAECVATLTREEVGARRILLEVSRPSDPYARHAILLRQPLSGTEDADDILLEFDGGLHDTLQKAPAGPPARVGIVVGGTAATQELVELLDALQERGIDDFYLHLDLAE